MATGEDFLYVNWNYCECNTFYIFNWMLNNFHNRGKLFSLIQICGLCYVVLIDPCSDNPWNWQLCVQCNLWPEAPRRQITTRQKWPQWKEWCISFDFYHNSSESVNLVLPCIDWNVACDLSKSVWDTITLHRKVRWCVTAIQLRLYVVVQVDKHVQQ